MWADRGPREGPHLQASGKGWGGGCTLGGRERRDRRTGRLAQWRAGLRDAPVSDSRAGSGGAAGLASGPRSRPIHSSSPVGMRLPVSLLWARPALSTAGIKGAGQQQGDKHRRGSVPGHRLPSAVSVHLGLPCPDTVPEESPSQPSLGLRLQWTTDFCISASAAPAPRPRFSGVPLRVVPFQALGAPPILTSCVHRLCTSFLPSPARPVQDGSP